GSAGRNCSLLFAPINSTAAWLQSHNTPVSGSYSQMASALRLKRFSNTTSLSPKCAIGALVLSPRSDASEPFMTDKTKPHDRHRGPPRNAVITISDLVNGPRLCRRPAAVQSPPRVAP